MASISLGPEFNPSSNLSFRLTDIEREKEKTKHSRRYSYQENLRNGLVNLLKYDREKSFYAASFLSQVFHPSTPSYAYISIIHIHADDAFTTNVKCPHGI